MSRSLRSLVVGLFVSISLQSAYSRAEILDFKLQNADGASVDVKPSPDGGPIRLIVIDKGILEPVYANKLSEQLKHLNDADVRTKSHLLFVGKIEQRRKLSKLFPNVSVLLDVSESVVRAFALKNTLDFVTLNGTDFTEMERGNLAAKGTKLPTSPLKLLKVEKINFKNQILPALSRNCMECHAKLHAQQLFADIDSVRNWQAMMLKTIRIGLMPAGFDPLDPPLVHGPSVEEMRTIVAWLDQGAPVPKGQEKAIEIEFNRLKQAQEKLLRSLGEPDLIVELPEDVVIPAMGKKVTKVFQLSTRTAADGFIDKAYLYSKATSMHHLRLFASAEPLKQEGSFLYLQNPIYERAPATLAEKNVFAAGTDNTHQVAETSRLPGFLSIYPCYTNKCYRTFVAKNSLITLQVHYLPNGLEEIDRPKLHIYFTKKDQPTPTALKKMLIMPHPKTFRIEPNTGPVTLHVEFPVKKKMRLLGYSMHAHLRATSSRLFVIRADGQKTSNLFSLPFFNYMIQPQKFLQKPINLAAGDRIVSELTYDNTANNDANPNPEATVTMGENVLDQDTHAASIFYEELETK